MKTPVLFTEKINDHIALALILLKEKLEEDSFYYSIESNIPDFILEELSPKYFNTLNECDTDESRINFCIELLDECKRNKKASFFFWFTQFYTYDDNTIIDRITASPYCFDYELNKLYSIQDGNKTFDLINLNVQYARLDTPKAFKMCFTPTSQKEFESYLPQEFGEEYINYYNKNNQYYMVDKMGELSLLLFNKEMYLKMFFVIQQK